MSLMSKTDFRKVWYAVLPLFVSYLPLGLASGILLTVGTFQRLSDVLDFSACFFRWGPIFSGGATGNAK